MIELAHAVRTGPEGQPDARILLFCVLISSFRKVDVSYRSFVFFIVPRQGALVLTWCFNRLILGSLVN